MDWSACAPISALLGGALLAISTGLVLLLNGRIAGISGVVARIMSRQPGDTAWRITFLLGMIAGGATMFRLEPSAATYVHATGTVGMAMAGLLVGLGTRVGGGCTSGHGICGLGRGSMRGLVATLVFIATGILTVYVRAKLGAR